MSSHELQLWTINLVCASGHGAQRLDTGTPSLASTAQLTLWFLPTISKPHLPSFSFLLFCAGLSPVYLITSYSKPLCIYYHFPAVDYLNNQACGVNNVVLFAEYDNSFLEEKFYLQELTRDFIMVWLHEEMFTFSVIGSLGNVS